MDVLDIRICDFGMAVAKRDIFGVSGVAGNVRWMAPEVLANLVAYNEEIDGAVVAGWGKGRGGG